MKTVSILFLVAFATCAYSVNTIIAIVNKTPITLNSVQINLNDSNSKEDQITIISNYIDNMLQVQKTTELKLTPTKNDIDKALIDLAQRNGLSLEELMDIEDFYFIEKEVIEKLSILNLQRFITKDLKVSEEQIYKACSDNNSIKDQKQIKIAQIIVSEIDSQTNDIDQKNLLIKTFLNKLANHIKKGASFEAFAKLHSQHPSYQNGGITNWLSVKGPTLEMLDLLNNKEVSEVYITNFGFAIATKVDERFISSKLEECKERVIYEYAKTYYSDWLTNRLLFLCILQVYY